MLHPTRLHVTFYEVRARKGGFQLKCWWSWIGKFPQPKQEIFSVKTIVLTVPKPKHPLKRQALTKALVTMAKMAFEAGRQHEASLNPRLG